MTHRRRHSREVITSSQNVVTARKIADDARNIAPIDDGDGATVHAHKVLHAWPRSRPYLHAHNPFQHTNHSSTVLPQQNTLLYLVRLSQDTPYASSNSQVPKPSFPSAFESNTMASESKNDFTVLVVGATGNIGKQVVTALSSKYPGATIKAGTRNPDSDKALALGGIDGVTVVKAHDSATIAEEAKGAEFLVIVPPGSEDRAAQGVAAAKAATAAGVTKIISYSVPGVADVLFARQFRELERGIRAVSANTIFLRLPFFTDNNWGHAATIKGMGKIFAPVPVDVNYAQVTVADAGEAGAAALAQFDRFAGQAFTLVSNHASQAEIAAAFSKAVGKEVTAVQVPPAAAKEALLGAGFPEWQVDGILELWAALSSDDVARHAAVNVASRDLEVLLGRKGTSIEQWVEAVKGAFA